MCVSVWGGGGERVGRREVCTWESEGESSMHVQG